MEIRVIGSTKPEYIMPVEDAKKFAGYSAGICYMKDDFQTILAEPEERTLGRFQMTAGSGHHSVAGHASYNLLIEDAPKIVAMILNNEKDYNTSEKSARYTVMNTEGREKELYEKWLEIFEKEIKRKHQELSDVTVQKLAQENARYFISVFTPSTTMEYTVDFRQANYLIGFLESPRIGKRMPVSFFKKLQPWLLKTASLIKSKVGCEAIRDNKGRELSFFAGRLRGQEFGETYSTSYYGSFAQVAQAQRHRSLAYEAIIEPAAKAKFFIPPIIEEDSTLSEEYLDDMKSVAGDYPQGMMVMVNERGTLENFLLKCHERLCGAAQWEICMQTKATLSEYYEKAGGPIVEEISEYIGKTKCQLGYYKCNRPCPLGAKNVFTRDV